ncbi:MULTISPECIES: ABCB family ABC transporter ATP-binding protein/permease [Methylobacterium]|uniref:ATP-binding cassette subfamily B protein n=1 Tax=Methylobacterium fujisawaense TaxID=107400 RepID=A0ABR6DBT5_9HYPH|nr:MULTISPECIES: ABC transporter ATP-binding protein/permease [Methylobacterium]MBA9063554.1 ATP-binding cassette subfamily B protein [Methylobacterium fujisawaense]MBP31205.1 metal ABC transporter permease [Methylobacterium sp.]MBP33369.1 metal ABC transporter permease [Methylobacterium sp.]RUP16194.1 MAG: ABC transporter ATP-binding protein/permease [Methylobacterium sp.]
MTDKTAPQAGPPLPAERPGLIATYRRLWPHLWPHGRPDLQRRVFLAFGLLLAAKLVTMVTPFTFKWITDALVAAVGGKDAPVPTGLLAAPMLLIALYGVSRIAMSALTQVRDGLFAKVAMHAVRRLALQTFEHMHRLSLRFHLERKTGGLTRVLERGRAGIEELSRLMVLTLVPTIVEFVLVLGVLAYEFSWTYAATAFVTVAAYLAFTYKATEWRIAIRRRMNASDTDANTKAVDSLLNYETVKYFGAERREAARYDESMARYEKASTQTYVSLAVLNAGQAVIFTLGMTVVMWLAARDILAGRTTIGGFVLANTMLVQLSMPLNFMGMIYREIKQALIDIDDMFRILGQNPEIADRPGAAPLAVAGGTVRFEDVRFAYHPERPILRGVSFAIPAGQTVAVVGPSGAGKSTLSRLLFRFYEPQGGRISIDGQDIAAVTQESLRAAIGMVPQDTVLFNDTIGYNIRYGRADATDAELREAARLAQIDRFVSSLPEGYDTPVGERGLKLSGGEKQRVAIARTILKAPPILVLDEATSALDSFTEAEIQSALDRVSRGRTTLVIAHRLSTVVNADAILVLDHGRIVERGTHAELLEAGGVYAALWDRQREADAALEVLQRADAPVAPRPGQAALPETEAAE